MLKRFSYIPIALVLLLAMLVSCAHIASDISSVSVIYGLIAFVSMLLAVGYCVIMKKREKWLMLLYIAVFVVNCGYFALSISKNLESALWANRVAYFGSVFLPISMLLTIMDVCGIEYKKALPVTLAVIGGVMFLIAASPGYVDWYYKDVSFSMTNGGALEKEYGLLHPLYLIYLLAYFGVMIAVVANTIIKKRRLSGTHSAILVAAVMGNIAVWGIEQIIDLQFEFLSISYIITEIFLLLLFLLLQQYDNEFSKAVEESAMKECERIRNQLCRAEQENNYSSANDESGYEFFRDKIFMLTATEKKVYEMYVGGKTTKEIIELLEITENTLKTHNKRIYKKLGVSSRKQMLEYARLLSKNA